ncbi:MAG: hypothetical protein ACRENA_10570 [Vulcanimicrobiaceae bacterium]
MRWLFFACCLLLLLPACSGGKGDADPEPTDTRSILMHAGKVMPLHEAIAGVVFRPFIPAHYIVETALLPPYNGGDDTRANRGIGFQYMSRNQAFVLKEWPGRGMPGSRRIGTVNGCDITAYDMNGGAEGKQGALWSDGLIASNLVPAGNSTNKAVFAEAKRLVRIGACR